MTVWDPRGQALSLDPVTAQSGNSQPVSQSAIGNQFFIPQGQLVSLTPETQQLRMVYVMNAGPIPVYLSTAQKNAPDGWHLASGDYWEFATSQGLWASVLLPPRAFTRTALYFPRAILSVSYAI